MKPPVSLHKPVSIRLSNRALAGFVLVWMGFGLLLPAMINPPFFLSEGGSNKALLAEIAKLEGELLRLQELKKQQGLSLAEKQALDRQMEIASAQLSKGLQLSEQKHSALLSVPTRRPPVPQNIRYSLPEDGQGVVPRIFIPRMPNLAPLEVAERKEIFIKILLPLILRANDEIKTQRENITRAYQKDDREVLEQYARQYKVSLDKTEAELYDALILRVAPVPVSLALAQAVIESGWGQSRFAAVGNALFGQWVWNDDMGIKARQASDSRASVRAFPDLQASVRAYMLNLNSFYAYEGFRQNRALYNQSKAKFGDMLAELSVYAEIGEKYVTKLKTVIAQNDFRKFSQTKLAPPVF